MKVYINGQKVTEFEGTLPVDVIKSVLIKHGYKEIENAVYTIEGDSIYFSKKANTLG